MKEEGISFYIEQLEKRIEKLEEHQENTMQILTEIKSTVIKVNEAVTSSKEQEDLKNQLLYKDIQGTKERIEKLESSQKWIVRSIIGEVLAIIFGIIMIFVQKGI